MEQEKTFLPDSALENLTDKEKASFAETVGKLTPRLKSVILEAIASEARSVGGGYSKVTTTTTHEKGVWN